VPNVTASSGDFQSQASFAQRPVDDLEDSLMSISKIDELISEGDSFLASSNSMKFRQAAPNFSVDCEVYAPG
jgi:hypothetical protein